jgi:prevent-host-death family protein
MTTKFSEDIVPISDLKVNPGRIVKQVQDVHRPVVVTSRGRGVAVVQSLQDYEAGVEERAFMKAVVKGMTDLEEGRELSLAEIKQRLALT